MPIAEIQFASREEYEFLRAVRDRHGVQWRGMLLQGARQVEGFDLRQALLQLEPVNLISTDEETSIPPFPSTTSCGHPVSGESEQEDTPGATTEPPADWVGIVGPADEEEN